jgi:eukaryotic-like serine/threonine-protein kinase
MLASALALLGEWHDSTPSDRTSSDRTSSDRTSSDRISSDRSSGDRATGAAPVGSPDPATAPSRTGGAAPPAAREPTGPEVCAARHWRGVLTVLDRRRAKAYAQAAPRLLRGVYTPGSSALRRDRSLLARYRHRGLRVRHLRMEVADLCVRTRQADRVVLRVRERVAAGTVIGAGRRRALVADDLDSRLLTLRRGGRRGWLVAAVRPAAR